MKIENTETKLTFTEHEMTLLKMLILAGLRNLRGLDDVFRRKVQIKYYMGKPIEPILEFGDTVFKRLWP